MFVCGLDVGATTLGMVVTMDEPDSAPQFMEGAHFPRSVEPARVVAQLEAWQEYYGLEFDRLACSHADLIPMELLVALEERGFVMEWVDDHDLREALGVWRTLQPDPRWLRGGLVALLLSSPMSWRRPGEEPRKAAWSWAYAVARREVLEMEQWVMAEGRLLCPDHLSPECSDCLVSWDHPLPWEDAWEEDEVETGESPCPF